MHHAFNQDIGGWDASNVRIMTSMFREALSFNQNIGNWNTWLVENMFAMFYNATAFNQDLTGWCVSSITSEPDEFFWTLLHLQTPTNLSGVKNLQ